MSDLEFFVNLIPDYNHPHVDRRKHLVPPGADKSFCGEEPARYLQTQNGILQRDPREVYDKYTYILCRRCKDIFESKAESGDVDVPEPPDATGEVVVKSILNNEVHTDRFPVEEALEVQKNVLQDGYPSVIETL